MQKHDLDGQYLTHFVLRIHDVGAALYEELQKLGAVVLRRVMSWSHVERICFVNVGSVVELRPHLVHLVLLDKCAEARIRRHDGAGRGESQVLRGGEVLAVSVVVVVTPPGALQNRSKNQTET